MAEARVGSVVVRQGDRVVGIFTERDLLRRVVAVGREPAGTRLLEVMSAPVQTCRLGDSLSDCARRMSQGRIRHLVVVEDGALLGLISLRDVLSARVCRTPARPVRP